MRVVSVLDLQYHNYLHWAPLSKLKQFLLKKAKIHGKFVSGIQQNIFCLRTRKKTFFLEKIYQPIINVQKY